MTSRTTTIALAALLFAITFLAYLPTLHNGFVQFDDPAYVTDNPHVISGLSSRNVAWAFTTFEQGNWHPITWLSHQLDCQLFGLRPSAHHAISIGLHALNAVLIFLLLWKATGHRLRSLAVAALFALHPINVESVSWLAERKSLLCMLFTLIAIGLYGRYTRAPRLGRYLAVVVAFALALLSKPMAVTLPVLLLLLDFWPLDRITLDDAPSARRNVAQLIIEKIPLFLMSAASSWITIVAQKTGGAVDTLIAIPLRIRLENSAISYVTYLRRIFWPSDLASFYPHPGLSISAAKAIFATVILVLLTVLAWSLRRRRYPLFGWLFFLLAMLPVIGILQVGLQSMADRYAYLPFLGIFTALVWGAAELSRSIRISRSIQAAAAVAVLLALSACTVKTEGYWHDDIALFTRAHDIASRPNLNIETNLAAALLDAGRTHEALQHFRLAESIAPRDFSAHYNIAYLSATTGDFATAEPELHTALACATTSAEKVRALNLLGMIYVNLGEKSRALEVFQQSLALDPNNRAAQSGLAKLQRR